MISLFNFYFLSVLLFCLYAYLCTTYVHYLLKSKQGMGPPEIGITGVCEPLCGAGNNLGHFQEQQELLVTELFAAPATNHGKLPSGIHVGIAHTASNDSVNTCLIH